MLKEILEEWDGILPEMTPTAVLTLSQL